MCRAQLVGDAPDAGQFGPAPDFLHESLRLSASAVRSAQSCSERPAVVEGSTAAGTVLGGPLVGARSRAGPERTHS